MKVEVFVSVSTLLKALGLSDVPDGCRHSLSDQVELSVDVDEDEILGDAIDGGKAVETEDAELHNTLDEARVRELSRAIRLGDLATAESALDALADGDFRVREWVDQARYSVARRKRPSLLKAA